jgi:hypothetical protein
VKERFLFLVAGLALAIPVTGQQQAGPVGSDRPSSRPAFSRGYVVPKTPWGDPDLQGIWSSDEEASVPFERPINGVKDVVEDSELEELLAEREKQRRDSAETVGGITGAGPVHWYEHFGRTSPRTSLVIDPPDGRVPALTAKAQARQGGGRGRGGSSFGNGPFNSYTDFSLYDRCITRGLPGVMFPAIYNNNTSIVQAPGVVAITYEMIHETRVVPLDGRPFSSGRIRHWMGEARGRWEGDALVVETKHFTGKTSYRGSADTLHLIERFTRVGDTHVRYEVTVNDPETFVRPWTAALNLTPGVDLFEYACHEGNYAMKNMLSGARAAEGGGGGSAEGK